MTTSTEIAVRENGQVAERDVVDGWLQMASDVIKLANVIAPTSFVPEAYRDNPPAVAAAILTGRELGIGPMTALRHVQMVKDTPTLSAEYKRARVLAAGHQFDIIELNTTRCRVSGRRRGSSKAPHEVTFTIEDARKAGLVKDKGAWVTRPRRMLFARASSELCDFLFADVVNGLPTAEVMADGAEADELPDVASPPAASEPEPAAQTAQRRTRRAPAGPVPSPAPEADGQPEAHTPTAQAAPGQVPLPGEDDPASPSDEDRHKALVGIVQQHFTRIGLRNRDARLLACEKLATTGPLESSKDLTVEQLSVVADVLARCKTAEQLNVLLLAGDKPGDGGGEPEGEDS